MAGFVVAVIRSNGINLQRVVIQHASDDRRGVMPACDHPTRTRRHAVMAGEVDTGQIDGLVRRSAGHGANIDTGDHFGAAADYFEVQVIVQRADGSVFPLQQL